MSSKNDYKPTESSCLQEVQRKLASFEDDVLPHLPSKETILARAKQRHFKRKALGTSIFSVLGVLCGIYWYNPVYEQFDAQTLRGQQNILRLQDGTSIHLNTDTQIQVQQRIRSREVILHQGEASFHVAHPQSKLFKPFERQFKVRAGQMQVIDIGTVFNVFKPNRSDVSVAVEQGEVAVKIIGSQQPSIHLFQGQSIHYVQQNLGAIQAVDVDRLKAWRSGEIVLNQTPLVNAIENFQRYTDFEVEVKDPDLAKIQVNGQFKAQNYQQFMQVLPIVAELHVEKVSDKKWIIK